MQIGPSTGMYYKLNGNERIVESFLSAVQYARGAIEIQFGTAFVSHAEDLMQHADAIRDIPYRSLHAPNLKGIHYSDNPEAHRVLALIEQMTEVFDLHTVNFHPDVIDDFSVFSAYPGIPYAFENMDPDKSFGQSVEDMETVFEQMPEAGIVIDLQHCFVNDRSMQLATDLHKHFADRLRHYHVSGYTPELVHAVLCRTQQDSVLDAAVADVPVVLEGIAEEADDVSAEMAYVTEHMG
ncbi:MAG: hypothetical protein TR69_WS6001000069 [candidate division WS6 bacterium OLB20]|uniref:Xylose isomerase-like TIM barrel n=1 Tax=candidate division WS6 bacterium OLB20 TaxID=1617426 RepID=A0A136M144_9BACT|nr:MAG: hypothetical protein TR69_WS6001000069 [candidate division WS6 bacterium OLB20]